MIKGKKILLTGGGGFIGTHLCRVLSDENEVVIYDNQHRDAIHLTDLPERPTVTFIKGDVMDAGGVEEAMAGCQMVIHLAAIAGIDTVNKRPTVTMKVNMTGTQNVLEAAVKEGVERLVDFSTSEVYGSFVYQADEGDSTIHGRVGVLRWIYAVSKLAAEHMTHCYHVEYGLPAVTVRPFNIYGPYQVGEGAIQKFILAALKDEPLFINGDGSQIRAWCYIDDFIRGVLLCLEKEEAVGEVFNIGNHGAAVTIRDLAEKIISLSGSSSKLEFRDALGADVALRIPSTKKALNLLGFESSVMLEEGLMRSIEWYRKMEEQG
jgi:nucleoside-diphosphate-sugar epimerase